MSNNKNNYYEKKTNSIAYASAKLWVTEPTTRRKF